MPGNLACLACTRPIRRHPILGIVHRNGRWFCDKAGDLKPHASDNNAWAILYCAARRKGFGY